MGCQGLKKAPMSNDPFSLNGKTALITGSGRGLGLEIAKGFSRAGAHVALTGLNLERLDAAAAEIKAEGGMAETHAFDVVDETQVDKVLASIAKAHGQLDILVNNVGMRDRRALDDFPMDDVRRLMDVNLIAPFYLSQQAAQQMKPGGRIINVTSIAGRISRGGDAAYTTSKGGLESLTRALAAEYGPYGINVNGIAPGYFATDSNREMTGDKGVADWLSQRTSLGRWGNPHEIAGAAVFLASPAASYVTGQILAVDGGYLSHF